MTTFRSWSICLSGRCCYLDNLARRHAGSLTDTKWFGQQVRVESLLEWFVGSPKMYGRVYFMILWMGWSHSERRKILLQLTRGWTALRLTGIDRFRAEKLLIGIGTNPSRKKLVWPTKYRWWVIITTSKRKKRNRVTTNWLSRTFCTREKRRYEKARRQFF